MTTALSKADAVVREHPLGRFLFAALFVMSVGCAASQARDDTDAMRLGLPDVPRVVDDRRLALGKRLFFDTALSADGQVSCASCHRPERGYTDGRPVGEGTNGRRGTRNVPSLINAVYSKRFFWDGRKETLASVVLEPLVSSVEHGYRDIQQVSEQLRRDAEYVRLFRAAYGPASGAINADTMAGALGAFVGSLVAADSPFDRYQYGGDSSALTPAGVRGLELFRGRGECTSCHTIEEKFALFSDQRFHSLGVGIGRIEKRLAQVALQATAGGGEAARRSVLTDPDMAELGRFVVTADPNDIGTFRTPSLRNVALTAPYMHDGSIATLEEAVERELYWKSLRTNRAGSLTSEEKADLVEFLKSLTSSRLP